MRSGRGRGLLGVGRVGVLELVALLEGGGPKSCDIGSKGTCGSVRYVSMLCGVTDSAISAGRSIGRDWKGSCEDSYYGYGANGVGVRGVFRAPDNGGVRGWGAAVSGRTFPRFVYERAGDVQTLIVSAPVLRWSRLGPFVFAARPGFGRELVAVTLRPARYVAMVAAPGDEVAR